MGESGILLLIFLLLLGAILAVSIVLNCLNIFLIYEIKFKRTYWRRFVEMIPLKKNACSNQDSENAKTSLLSCIHKTPLKPLISEGFFLFFVYCGAGFELPYAFSLYSRFPWPASTTTIPSSASCCMRDSVRLKLVPRDLESANRSLVGWSVR